jgi:hypothetical protein
MMPKIYDWRSANWTSCRINYKTKSPKGAVVIRKRIVPGPGLRPILKAILPGTSKLAQTELPKRVVLPRMEINRLKPKVKTNKPGRKATPKPAHPRSKPKVKAPPRNRVKGKGEVHPRNKLRGREHPRSRRRLKGRARLRNRVKDRAPAISQVTAMRS